MNKRIELLMSLEVGAQDDHNARTQGTYYGCHASRSAQVGGIDYSVRVIRARVNTPNGVIDGTRKQFFIDGRKVSRAKFYV